MLPDLAPMLPQAGPLPPEPAGRAPRWGAEVKWDGVRVMVHAEGARLRLVTRNGIDTAARYPELARLPAALGAPTLLDGEIVAFDPATGRPSFGLLQQRMHVTRVAELAGLTRQVPVTLVLFDVLHAGGVDLLALPYAERRAHLDGLGAALPPGHWQVPPAFPGGGAELLAASRQQGLEGVVVKRLDSPYQPGRRSDCWVKVKNVRRQEAVVGGWAPGEGGRSGQLGALVLGMYDKKGRLVYVGRVGSGLAGPVLSDLAARLAPLRRATSPFPLGTSRETERDAVWVQPTLVVEVGFGEWSRDTKLRFPTYKGLRCDKEPRDVGLAP